MKMLYSVVFIFSLFGFFLGFAGEVSAATSCQTVSFVGETCGDIGLASGTDCSPGCTGTDICCDDGSSSGTTCGSGGTCQKSACDGVTYQSEQDTTGTCTGTSTPYCCKLKSTTTPTASSGGSTIEFENPLKYDTASEVISAVLNGLQGIIITLSLVFLIAGAIRYIASFGSEEHATAGKNAMFAAGIGLFIALAAPTFLREIAIIVGWGEIEGVEEVSEAPRIAKILLNILNGMLAFVGMLAIIIFVSAGITYLLSGGSEEKAEVAKRTVKAAMIGVLIALGALVIVNLISSYFIK